MVSGIYGKHGDKESRLINNLIKDGYRYIILDFDYKGVSRDKSKKQGKEILIMNY
jgi:hypothetical protein